MTKRQAKIIALSEAANIIQVRAGDVYENPLAEAAHLSDEITTGDGLKIAEALFAEADRMDRRRQKLQQNN